MKKIIFYSTLLSLGVLFLNAKTLIAVDNKDFHSNNILFSNNIALEYGESVDFNKFHIKENAEVFNTNYDSKLLGKNEISLFIKTDKMSYKIKRNVIVQDTKNPVVELKNDKVYITKGNKYDFKNNIKSCFDPIDGDIVPEIIGNVDFDKVGEYEVQVKGIDANKNETIKKFKVFVKNEQVVPQHVVDNGFNKIKQHYINISRIRGSYKHKYTQKIHDAIFSGNYDVQFPYEVDDYEFQYSLWEFETSIFGRQTGFIYYSRNAAEQYYYLRLREKEIFESEFKDAKNKINNYENYIVKALKTMNLNCTDAEMAQQINNYIVKNFSYKITDIYNVRSFVELGVGQCWHYAKFFQDMCKVVGLNVKYIEGKAYGDGHAWNSLTIDGKKYYFDVTLNDSMKTNKWSFVSEATLRKTHSW